MSLADRLDALAADVRRLSLAMLDDERASGELSCTLDATSDEDAAERASALAAAKAYETRLRRDQALVAYFEENEKERARWCALHGASIIAACDVCRRVHGLDRDRKVA